MRADCRNLLCIHRGARSQFRGSDVLDMAVAARAMFPVDAKSILWHAFPCCARGGACCPPGRGPKRLWPGCCSHGRVHEWLSQQIATGGTDVRWFAATRWYDQGHFTYRKHSVLHALHTRELRRKVNNSGLSLAFN